MSNWKTPETAPKDGAIILKIKGCPFVTVGAWNSFDKKWNVCTLSAEVNGDLWFENEQECNIEGWQSLPEYKNSEKV